MSFRQFVARLPGARWLRGLLTGRKPRDGSIYDDRPQNRAVRADLWRLANSNRFSRRSVVDAASTTVVTMTTHGTRISTVHIAIESIARGDVLPARLILWLDDERLAERLPRPLRRLQARGLEVRVVPPGMRVHTKYYFYLRSWEEHTLALVTSDDDIVYPPEWLASLQRTAAAHPDCVCCFRAHTVQFTDEGLAPYGSWLPCTSDLPSYRHFGTSVSGQLFPSAFLDFARSQGDAFLQLAPDADDIWLHSLAVRSGFPVVQVAALGRHFPFVPGTQASGLYQTNTLETGNDRQIASTYSAADIDRMRRAR